MSEPKRILFNSNLDFDETKFVVNKPENKKFDKGGSNIEYVKSSGYYKDNDNLYEVFIEGPTQNYFGINPTFPLGYDGDKSVDDITGLQIYYPLSSIKTVEEPTPEEVQFQTILNAIKKSVINSVERECSLPKDKRVVPPPTYSSFLSAREEGDISHAVKPISTYPFKKNDKNMKTGELDKTKPQRMYVKLKTFGKGKDINVHTSIYGPGDKKVNVLSKLDIIGTIHPVFKWEGVYWGAHGSTSYGASATFKLVEANVTFSPGNLEDIPRFLSPNLSVEKEEDEEETVSFKVGEPKTEEEEDNSPDPLDLMKPESSPKLQVQKEEPPKPKKTVKVRVKRGN